MKAVVKVTKKAERLARALYMVDSSLNFNMAFDRGYFYWPTMLEKAQNIISTQNLFEFCEGTRPLHECVKAAEDDRDEYERHYKGPDSHARATALAIGLEDDDELVNQQQKEAKE
jgi:hypothetical protein